MNDYIATFYSHFGALQYCKALKAQRVSAKLMPVPRSVSASCGTCVRYASASFVDLDGCELDGIFIKEQESYDCVFRK